MVILFTDFGLRGPYVGQLHAVFARDPHPPTVLDLLHDAPAHDPRASAHLLAALARQLPIDSVFLTVVDPGVGTDRRPLVVQADRQWFVGPDNGLLNVVSARASRLRWWCIEQPPASDYATFHGRDLFAPVAAAIARGEGIPGSTLRPDLSRDEGDDLAQVIYVDAFGNAMTGLRARDGGSGALSAGGGQFQRARTFDDVGRGEAMWLVNSLGLIEIAVNQGSAAERFGLEVGTPVHWYSRAAG